jgi:DNA-binding NarL/FixJ family response regulator
MTPILVADDHPVVRQGIRQIVAETPDLLIAEVLAHQRLSDREYQVLRMMAAGKPTRQIGVGGVCRALPA